MKGLIDIDGITNKARKPRKSAIPPCVGKVKRLIDSGEYDPSNPTHVRMRNVAVRHGELPDE